jgi:VCBS repeat-containing protein
VNAVHACGNHLQTPGLATPIVEALRDDHPQRRSNPRPSNGRHVMKTDLLVHKDVAAELAWDPRLDKKEIGVAVQDGVVTLTGSVSSYVEKLAAERAVEHVVGVRAVANDLTVSVPSGLEHTDTQLAHGVADALAWDIEVPKTIKASVSNGWVTLAGDVQWKYQRDAAVRAVQHLAGVRGLSNDIVVVPQGVAAADVTASIKQALERRADRTAEKIVVNAKDGVVTLTGSVSSYADRRAIEGAAWSAAGVRDVHDEIVVVL